MRTLQSILDNLKSKGYRLTKARTAIVGIFSRNKMPLSAADLDSQLKRLGLRVNKTTIYREVEFLKSQKIIREFQFGDGKKRFESWPDNHHHHLVCVRCETIECIELDRCLEAEEKRILEENNFKTINHSLEFQGLCARCQ